MRNKNDRPPLLFIMRVTQMMGKMARLFRDGGGMRRSRAMPFVGLLAGAMLIGGAAAPAQQADRAAGAGKPVRISLTQFKVVKDAKGAEKLVAAAAVMPGDILEYRATYTNNGAAPVTNLVANLPIPAGTEYLPRSARPLTSAPLAATSDGVFGAEPLMRRVNGQARAVPYGEYRALRWRIGTLPARGTVSVSTRAKVEVVRPPARPGAGGT